MLKKLNKEQFIEKSNLIHNNYYNYSLVDYINSRTKVKIICLIHGIFEQLPKDHLTGHGCLHCGNIIKSKKLKHNKLIFINKSHLIHDYFYNYSLVDYINSQTKVKIICPNHGIFQQKPNNHLNGQKCPKCQKNFKLNKNYFIQKSNIIHLYKYDYSLINYKNNKTYVDIICKKHGIFKQRPDMHLQRQGCPKCKTSKGEKEIEKILKNNNIIFETQKRFKECKNNRMLPFDFYLPDYNICIEYDGEQHYTLKEHWGGEKEFNNIQLRDQIKNEYCIKNNIKLIRIKYDEKIDEKLLKLKYLI